MTPIERIAQLTRALAEARAAALEGAQIDLAGLAGAVEETMEQSRMSPLTERAGLVACMLGLLKELDHLVTALARREHAGAQRRAASAYGAAAEDETTP
jgi:hypothetical protein